MSDWYGNDDELLGRWVLCSEVEYQAIWEQPIDWTVFASHTEVGDSDGDGYRNRHVYTEWGNSGDAAPLIACDDRWDYWGNRVHTHTRFVRVGAA
jgi:hypothetical protein